MPDLTQMHTFVLTASLGSLAAAARKLNISPPAVSKQLTRLEQELGLQLLIRTTRQIALTEIGQAYYLQCQRVLEEAEAASALISQIQIVPHGSLKVCSGRHFATSYIVPHLNEFLDLFPKIELNLELAERQPDLKEEDIDVLIGMSVPATEDAIQKRIATTRYVFCATPKYLKQFGIPKKPSDLAKHRYITHSMRKPDNELMFPNNKLVILTPFLRVNDAQTMLNLALDNMGIVKLHHYVVEVHLKNHSLQEVLSPFTQQEIPIYVAYPQRRFTPSKVRCFIDFIDSKIHKKTRNIKQNNL